MEPYTGSLKANPAVPHEVCRARKPRALARGGGHYFSNLKSEGLLRKWNFFRSVANTPFSLEVAEPKVSSTSKRNTSSKIEVYEISSFNN